MILTFVVLQLANKVIIYPPLATDCLDPLNLAILWMAEAEPVVVSVDKTVRRFILAVLFHSTGGVEWFDQSYWLTNRSACTWHGVQCNSYFAIEQIQLPDNNLIGSIPKEVADFPYLRTFNVTGNKLLVGTIPDQIEKLISDGRLKMDTNGTSIRTNGGE
jgi:hypothetical protein